MLDGDLSIVLGQQRIQTQGTHTALSDSISLLGALTSSESLAGLMQETVNAVKESPLPFLFTKMTPVSLLHFILQVIAD